MSDDRRARFEAIAHEVIEPVRRFLARRTDPDTAEEALSETLLVCWRRIDEVPEPPLPWVYGVARLCLANAERGERRQRRVAGRIAAVDPPTEVAATERTPAMEAVSEALDSLPENDRTLLRLWAWEQLGAGEIAIVLDITPNAASIRLHRAREKLSAALRKIPAGAGHEETKKGGTP